MARDNDFPSCGPWARCRRRGENAVACALALALTLAPSAGLAARQSSDLAELLAAHGVRPLTPAPASDFTLPSISGGEASLSDFGGQWIVLTFWATWCGPCRMEMPSLETLHRQRRNAGLAVLGVSVDAQRGRIRPFVDELGLTFPMLWDSGGAIGSSYRASSIPLTYLVDPAGKLVGISRGARDWSAMIPLIDTLLEEFPRGTAEPEFAAAGPVLLPEILDPPSAEVELVEESPMVGETFHLDVRLRWRGDFQEYLPQPPRLELPAGVVREGVTAITDSRDGANLVTYRMALRADEPGRYALDPVELRYTPSFESTVMTDRTAGPSVEVAPRPAAGVSTPVLVAVSAGILAAAAFGWQRLRSGRAAEPVETSAQRYERLEGEFRAARERRIAGDAAGFVTALAELESEIGLGAEGSEEAASRRLSEEVRYGGQVPPAAELDRWQRRVELALEDLRPDARREVLAGVRFKKPQQRRS